MHVNLPGTWPTCHLHYEKQASVGGGDLPCSVSPSLSLPTSCSQFSLSAGSGSSSSRRVRSSLALEGRMCQNHSSLSLPLSPGCLTPKVSQASSSLQQRDNPSQGVGGRPAVNSPVVICQGKYSSAEKCDHLEQG